MWLLFETPSGFAIFSVVTRYLRPVENIWTNFRVIFLKQFQEFEDKSAAINHTTGLDNQLRDLLKKWTRPKEKLAVGSLEHKEIIDADQELRQCIVETAWFLYDCDLREGKHSKRPHGTDRCLREISGFNSQHWDALKLAAALKMLYFPQEEIWHPPKCFQKMSCQKYDDVEKYVNKFSRYDVSGISEMYRELAYAFKCKELKLRRMEALVKEVKEAMDSTHEAESS
ncbi:hypothetical protein ACP70R_002781 [Stipagrostis hirtigluma subsp. patula]